MNDPLIGTEVTGERFLPTSDGPLGIVVNVKRYLSVLTHVKDKRVLDLGCGAGMGTYFYSLVAKSVHGVDYSAEAIEYAKHFPSPGNTTFEQMDLRTDYPKGEFDIVVALEFLEHVEDPKTILECVKKSGAKEMFFSLPLSSLTTSIWHRYDIKGLKDVTDLMDPFLRVDRYELMDRNWIIGHGIVR